jgi:hypothetical protein
MEGIELIKKTLENPSFQKELAKIYVFLRLNGKHPDFTVSCQRYEGDSYNLEDIYLNEGGSYWNPVYNIVEKTSPMFIQAMEEIMEYYNDSLELEINVDEISREVLEFKFDLIDKEFIFNHRYDYYDVDYQGTSVDFENIEGQVKEVIDEFCIANKSIKFHFNGGGDSGYIDSEGMNQDDETFDLPAGLEDYFYEMLNEDFGGWEINEGSQGNFTVDCSEEIIEMEIGINREENETNQIFRTVINFDVNSLRKKNQ